MVLDNYIREHLNNPLYLAAQKTVNKEVIPFDLQEGLLNRIFQKSDEINLHLDMMIKMNFGMKELFFRNYQTRFEEIDNKYINLQAFKAYTGTKEKKDFNIYKSFGMFLDRNTFYNELENNNLFLAYSYSRFIKKIKNSVIDQHSYPYPYKNEQYKRSGLSIAEGINVNLLSNIKSIFKYQNINCRTIILDAFLPDFKVVLSHKNETDYLKTMATMLYDLPPSIFQYVKNKHGVTMDRTHKINYVMQNAINKSQDDFKYFCSSFKSLHLDEDIIGDLVVERATFKDNHEKHNFDRNMLLFKTMSTEQIKSSLGRKI